MVVNATFGDREMVTDLLSDQKRLTGDYNSSASESANNQVKNVFLSILSDEHAIAQSVFTCMSERGWYPVEAAPQDKITTVKNQFSAS